MKICFVYCHQLPPDKVGFSEQHPCRLARIMENSATIYALYSGVANEELFRRYGVNPVNVNSSLLSKGYLSKFVALAYYTYKIGRKYNIDVFMDVWDHFLMLPIWIGAKLCRAQAVASLGGVPIKKDFIYKPKSFKNRLVKKMGLLLEWCSLSVVPRIHAVSYSLRTEFINRGVCSNKIHVISRGMDTNVFKFAPFIKKDGRNEEFHIGTVGRLVRGKDIETLIDAFDELASKKYTSMYLDIVGDGDHKTKLMEIVSNKGLNNKIIFHGKLGQKELPEFYSNMDLFVLASISEGIANVILEALAVGVPVVSTKVGDIPLHLKEGRGFLFDVGDYRTLAKTIEDLYLGKQDTETTRRNRRNYILENHSFACVKEQYLDFFQSVL